MGELNRNPTRSNRTCTHGLNPGRRARSADARRTYYRSIESTSKFQPLHSTDTVNPLGMHCTSFDKLLFLAYGHDDLVTLNNITENQSSSLSLSGIPVSVILVPGSSLIQIKICLPIRILRQALQDVSYLLKDLL